MADVFWTSNSDTDWDTGANWSGGSAPVLNDNVFFTGEGTADCTGPVTLADLGTGTINVAESYTGKLGTSGQNINVDAASIHYFGEGEEAWFYGDYDDVYVRTGQTGVNAFNLYGDGATALNLYVSMGRVNILSGSSISSISSGWSKEPRRDAMVYVQDSCTVSNRVRIEGGYFESASALSGTDGVLLNGATVVFSSQAGNIILLQQHGGRLDYLGNGSIATAIVDGPALFDIGKNGRAMTIGYIEVGAGAEARLNRGGNVVSFTASPIVWGDGKIDTWQGATSIIRV